MVASLLSFVAIASSISLIVRGEVFPDKPAGDVYTTGKDCLIHWTGDTNSTTNWKDMAIELMTGDNFNMVHLTTVATGQDGTVDGSFTHTCPGVAPNAPIYFYQFTSPNIQPSETQWTTRFTIADENGHTDPAPNATQPDGKAIPWGIGKLLDPSTATPPPDFANPGGDNSTTTSGSSDNTTVGSTTPTGASTTPTQTLTNTKLTTTKSSNTNTAAPTTTSKSPSGAIALGQSAEQYLIKTFALLATSMMAFAVLL
jgi:hypothetical protein